MNKNEEYFVSLISSHLNNTAPPVIEAVDFDEVYRLAYINNVVGIVATQVQRLSKKNQPDGEIMSAFRQQLGYTLIDTEKKENAVETVRQIFTENNIDFLFVKGQIIKSYYPVPALRTSADTDIIVPDQSLDMLKKLLSDSGYEIFDQKVTGFSAKIDSQNIEIHGNSDFDNAYFKDIFSLCTKNGNEYFIDDYNHLIYILCHTVKHFKYCGAGIKMFMDIDTVIRHINNFDYEKALGMSKAVGIEMFFKSALSLCNYMFSTPVKAEIDFSSEAEFRELFEGEIIGGGSFGFSKRDLGSYYEIRGSRGGKPSKLKAFFAYAFPKKEYLIRRYDYAKRYPLLLPLAWLNRLFTAVFRRGSHSAETIFSIAKGDNKNYIKLLNELEI